jgi:hypothetical protein
MARAFRFGVLAMALLGSVALAPAAQAANWLEMNFYLSGPRYDGVVPECDVALPWIASKFSEKESTFWNSALSITGFDGVRETAFRPWANDTIPRRFCTARAYISDGSMHPVNFWIGEDTGIIGSTWGVEWCVVGLDRNWAYNPRCKMAKP